MKKYLFGLVIILTFSIIAILPAKGYARWVLYDDFNYEDEITDPDPNLWVPYSFPTGSDECGGTPPEISVENGKLKFVHYPEAPHCSRWLKMINIKKAKAVRVTVSFEGPCLGYVNGRLGAVIGRVDKINHVFQCIQVRDVQEIDTGILSETEDGVVLDHIFNSRFGYRPIEDFYGADFTIQMSLNRRLLNFRAFGFGETSFIPPERIFKYDDFRVSIGTRNSYDPCCTEPPCPPGPPCTIYFDDVYVEY